MKKKLLALVLAATMALGLAACGSDKEASKGEATDGGKVLNIYCWNNEFRTRLTDHYDAYEAVSETEGKIGDVVVKWHETPNADNQYQNALDAALLAQKDAAADDKVDLFLVEADYAVKYVDTDYTLDVKTVGITKDDIKDQYKYTQDAVTDSKGVLKGLSWLGCPCVMIYKADIAESVLGTSDPAAVQEYVKDWDTFNATAETMKAAGYKMVSGYDDTFRIFSNNATSPWVKDGKLNIDASIKDWIDQTKLFTQNEYNNKTTLWGDGWSTGFTAEGDVFCYFGPAWFVDYTARQKDADGNATNDGLFKATEGPQSFFWGGTWMCAANGTDNAKEIKDMMLAMTTDAEVMKGIVEKDADFANNKKAMEEMAASGYTSDFLGGQNPLPMYIAGAENISLENITAYDQGCNEKIQSCMKDYFDGNCTYEEALANFKNEIKTMYPELTVE